MAGLGLSGGYAAGEGADMLQRVIQAAAERAAVQKRQALAEQELRQRAEAEANDRALREKIFTGQQEDRADARTDRAAVAAATAEDRKRNDMLARIRLIPQGTSFDAGSEFQSAAPELFETERAGNTPGFTGPEQQSVTERPTGKIRFRGTSEQAEKDAARTAAEQTQSRQFEQQMKVIDAQGRNQIAAAAAGRAPAASAAADAKTAAQQQETNEINDAIALIDRISGDSALGASVGPVDARLPDLASLDPEGVSRFRRGHEQLSGLLQLANAGKIKGQGQVSNIERQMLKEAATSLNLGTGEAAYRAELQRLREYFQRKAQQGGIQVAPSKDPLGIR